MLSSRLFLRGGPRLSGWALENDTMRKGVGDLSDPMVFSPFPRPSKMRSPSAFEVLGANRISTP